MRQTEYSPQIKICGLTRENEALACAEAGADAIGFVFYPKSPRFVSDDQAKGICDALPSSMAKIGVFVDESLEAILRKYRFCGLTGIQLHGGETPEFIEELSREGVWVVKGLFTRKSPSLSDVAKFKASAYLVECGKGKLPGGNAMAWDWSEAFEFGMRHPLVLAGGLTPENVEQAISQGLPDAVDVSSGVESSPGRKDPDKAATFIENVRRSAVYYAEKNKKPRNIFELTKP